MKDLRSLVSEILTEVLTDRVYHYANVDQLKNIIQKDYFLPSVAVREDSLGWEHSWNHKTFQRVELDITIRMAPTLVHVVATSSLM